MRINKVVSNSTFGEVHVRALSYAKQELNEKKSKIEKAAKGNDVYIDEDIDTVWDICDGWTVSMPAKDKSAKIAWYSAKIPNTNGNLQNIGDIVAEAAGKLSQLV